MGFKPENDFKLFQIFAKVSSLVELDYANKLRNSIAILNIDNKVS